MECICHHRIRVGTGTGLIRASFLTFSIGVAILIGHNVQRDAFTEGVEQISRSVSTGPPAIRF